MGSNFVVDNSVVISWLFRDEANNYADAVLNRLSMATAHVPSIWPLEVLNVLLTAERRKRISQADSARYLTLLGQLPIIVEYEPPQNIMTILMSLGRENNLTSYDASYLDLAMRNGYPIATLDKKLIEAAENVDVTVFSPL